MPIPVIPAAAAAAGGAGGAAAGGAAAGGAGAAASADIGASLGSQAAKSGVGNLGASTGELLEYKEAVSDTVMTENEWIDSLNERQQKLLKDNQLYKDRMKGMEKGSEIEKKHQKMVEQNDRKNKAIDKARALGYKEYVNGHKMMEKGTKTMLKYSDSLGKFALGWKIAGFALRTFLGTYGKLYEAHMRVWAYQEDLQKSLSMLSTRFGAASDAILQMRQEAVNQLLDPNGLGKLGYTLDEIVTKLSDFQDAFVYTNHLAQKGRADLIGYGTGIGMTAQQVGELAFQMDAVGKGADDVKKFMVQVAWNAKRVGVTATALTKQFQGAGKAIWDFSGPKAREQLVKTAAELAKMGTGLDKIAGFIEKTDSFDQTVEAMSKINTVFGTNINALQLFATQNEKERLDLVLQNLKASGADLNMSKQRLMMLSKETGLDATTLQNGLKRLHMTKQQLAELDAQEKVTQDMAKYQEEYEASLSRSKTMLMLSNAIAARMNEALTSAMEPLYRGFGQGAGLPKNLSLIDGFIEKWNGIIKDFRKNLENAGFGDAMFKAGKYLGSIWDQVTEFLRSPAIAKFVTSMVSGFSKMAQIFNAILPVILTVGKFVMYLVGIIGDVIDTLWPIISPIIDAIAWVLRLSMKIVDVIMSVISGGFQFIKDIFTWIMKQAAYFVGWVIKKLTFGLVETSGYQEGQAQYTKSVGGSRLSGAVGTEQDNGGNAAMLTGAGRMMATEGINAGRDVVKGYGMENSIPRFAEGGFIPPHTVAVVGDGGPELVRSGGVGASVTSVNDTSSLMDMITEIATLGTVKKFGGSSGGETTIHVQVHLDGEVIQDKMYKANLRSVTT